MTVFPADAKVNAQTSRSVERCHLTKSMSTEAGKSHFISRLAPIIGICVILLGCLAYGYSLDRYPSFYVDEVVFAFPAFQAAHRGAFAYPGGYNVPFVNEIWAYHGPVLPNLELLLFKIFGFSVFASRLPSFFGAWLAALLIVLYLNRRGYRFAGLLFAVMWCGDRAVQEALYARMDGLALLGLVLTFLCLERAWENKSQSAAFACGLIAGFTVLIHPLCIYFAFACFILILYRVGWMATARFCIGGLLNLPLLMLFWHFHPIKSWIQFHYVETKLNEITGLYRIPNLIHVLRWSRYWFCALVLIAIVCFAGATITLIKRKPLTKIGTDLLLAAAFCGAALLFLEKSSLFPYYVVYFSVWPMMCIAILTERYRRQFQPVAIILAVVWCSSAAWNLLRLREAAMFHGQLSHRSIISELKNKFLPTLRS